MQEFKTQKERREFKKLPYTHRVIYYAAYFFGGLSVLFGMLFTLLFLMLFDPADEVDYQWYHLVPFLMMSMGLFGISIGLILRVRKLNSKSSIQNNIDMKKKIESNHPIAREHIVLRFENVESFSLNELQGVLKVAYMGDSKESSENGFYERCFYNENVKKISDLKISRYEDTTFFDISLKYNAGKLH